MMERSKDADVVGSYLRSTYPDYFAGDKLQVIHTDVAGEISTRDVEKARAVVKGIDAEDSPINAVVSVMMLREGLGCSQRNCSVGTAPIYF